MEDLFKVYFTRYKYIIIPLIAILASIFIVMWVVIPQITSISELSDSIEQQEKEVDALRLSLQTITALNNTDMDQNLDTVLAALPQTKDIISIFTALTTVALDRNVNLSGFSVKVGDVYDKNPEKNDSPSSSSSNSSIPLGTPQLVIDVQATADDTQSLIDFITALQSALPLSEMQKTSISGNQATYTISFFYQPYNLAALAKQEIIKPLTISEEELLNTLKTWKK